MPDLSFIFYLPPLPAHVKAMGLLLAYAWAAEQIGELLEEARLRWQ